MYLGRKEWQIEAAMWRTVDVRSPALLGLHDKVPVV